VKLAVRNRTTLLSDVDLRRIIAASTFQQRRHLAPAWGIVAPEMRFMATVPPGWDEVVVVDRSSKLGAIGHHAERADGSDYAEVAVEAVLRAGNLFEGPNSVSALFTHEANELALNPFAAYWVEAGRIMCPLEPCDPVAQHAYPVRVAGGEVWVSNFVMPAWFDGDTREQRQLDFMKVTRAPLQVAPGGYLVTRTDSGIKIVNAKQRPAAWRREHLESNKRFAKMCNSGKGGRP